MLISVFGTDFEMIQKLRKIFKRGLWKAAENADLCCDDLVEGLYTSQYISEIPVTRMVGSHIRLHMAMPALYAVVGLTKFFHYFVSDTMHRCWIITDGLSRGITRLTGEAIRDYTDAYGGSRMLGFGVCLKSNISQFEVIEKAPVINHQPVLYKNIESSTADRQVLDSNFSYLVIIDDDEPGQQRGSVKAGRQRAHQKHPQRQESETLPGLGGTGTEHDSMRVVVERVMSVWHQTVLDNTTGIASASTNHNTRQSSTDDEGGLGALDEEATVIRPVQSSSTSVGGAAATSSSNETSNDKTEEGPQAVSSSYRVPICGLLVGGDLQTLSTMHQSVSRNKCPIIVIKGTNGVADLLAEAISIPPDPAVGAGLEADENYLDDKLKAQFKEHLTDEIAILTEEKIQPYIEMMKQIISDHVGFVSVFNVAEDWDLDGYMISALLSSANVSAKNQLNLEQLDITLRLNRADIARDKIFLEGKRWGKDALNPYMYRALMTDKHEFVRLFLDQGFSLDEFLTVHILEKLYTDQLNKMNSKIALFRQLWAPHRSTKVNLRDVGKMIRLLIGEFYHPLYLSKQFHSKLIPQRKEEKKSETLDAMMKSSNIVVTSGILMAGNKSKYLPNLSNRRKSSLDFILHPKLRQKILKFNKSGLKLFSQNPTANQGYSVVVDCFKAFCGSCFKENDESYNEEADENLKKKVKLDRPARELMIWSLLVGKLSMTELFWTLEKEPVAAALLVSMLLNSLGCRTDDFTDKEDYQEEAKHFETLAEGVLNECYREDERRAQMLINRELDFYGHSSVIRLAAQGKCIKFMAHPCCQDFLTSTWMGRISNKNSSRTIAAALFLGISLPLLIPKIVYYKYQEKEYNNISTEKEQQSPLRQNTLRRWSQNYQITGVDSQSQPDDLESNHEEKKRKFRDIVGMMIDFYVAPVTRFAYNMIFYSGFLCLYSYIMLVSFNVRFNASDYFLIFWIASLFFEEIKQIVKEGTFRTYIADGWNKLDCVAISLFICGLVLRVYVLVSSDAIFNKPLTDDEDQFIIMTNNYFVAARVFYCFSLFVFYVRLMYIFSFHIALGPKLVMIGKMVYNDLIPFMIILGVILAGYTISLHGIAFPNGYYAIQNQSAAILGDPSMTQRTDMAQNFITVYFQMYGEFGLDWLRGENDRCTSKNQCPHWTSKLLVPLMMCMFVLMTNILLFNLLIAMFSRTYEEIESSSTYYWNFQRYEMIAEYIDRSPLAPPFIVLWYFYGIVIWVRRKIFIVKQEAYEKQEDPFCLNYSEDNPTKNRELIKWEHLKAADYMRNLSEPGYGTPGMMVAARGTGTVAGVGGGGMGHHKVGVPMAAGPGGAAAKTGRMQRGVDPSDGGGVGAGSMLSSEGIGQMMEYQLDRVTKDLNGSVALLLEQAPTNQRLTELQDAMTNQVIVTGSIMDRLNKIETLMMSETPRPVWIQQSQMDLLLQKMQERIQTVQPVMSAPPPTKTVDVKCQTRPPEMRDEQTSVRPRVVEKSSNTTRTIVLDVATQIGDDNSTDVLAMTSPQQQPQAPTGEDTEQFFTAFRAKMLDVESASGLSRMIIEPRRLRPSDADRPDPNCDPRQVPDLALLSTSYLVRGYVSQRDILEHRLWRLCPINFELYPGVRANVPQSSQPWSTPYSTYAPFQISDERLLYPNDESTDPSEISVNMVFNSYDRTYGVWRTSLGERYLVDRESGLPLNPRGRTGLRGRGFLPRWGPNHATFLLFTRLSSNPLARDTVHLEFGAIKSGETLYIPFYFTDHQESCFVEDCVVNVVLALLYRRVRSLHGETRTNELIDPVVHASISVISEAYINDTLNADNAWIEGTLVNFHEDDEFPLENELIKALVEDNSKESHRWAKVAHSSQIRQSHKNLLRKLAVSRQASY